MPQNVDSITTHAYEHVATEAGHTSKYKYKNSATRIPNMLRRWAVSYLPNYFGLTYLVVWRSG